MATTIRVDNLPSDMTAGNLKEVFAQLGEVQSVSIRNNLRALLTNRPEVYGIVEMALDIDAYRAIHCFHGALFSDRKIQVQEAYPLFEKAKSMFDHFTDGYSLPRTRALDAFKRRTEQRQHL